jgi:hypothetical protein
MSLQLKLSTYLILTILPFIGFSQVMPVNRYPDGKDAKAFFKIQKEAIRVFEMSMGYFSSVYEETEKTSGSVIGSRLLKDAGEYA